MKTHHITEFSAILAAYAAGHTVHWKHEGYRLAGGLDPGRIAVQYPSNGHCCGLFHTDGVTSSYDPADFQIVPVSRPLAPVKTINDQTRLQFTSYLRHTLIPDFRADDRHSTAEDFETSLQFICDDVEAMHDARKALLAASAHLPAGSNAAALVAASVKELDEILGYPQAAKRETPVQSRGDTPHWLSPETPEERQANTSFTVKQSRRCLEDRSKLHD